MSKELHCGDVIPGCDHVIRGETVEEVLEAGAEHAASVHGIEEMDEASAARVKEAIRDA